SMVSIILMSTTFLRCAESLSIIVVPTKLPKDTPLSAAYSPPIIFGYDGLVPNSHYTLKVWLLAATPPVFQQGSTQWDPMTFLITNTTGTIQIATNMDVFNYD